MARRKQPAAKRPPAHEVILGSIVDRVAKIRALLRKRPLRPYEAVLEWKLSIGVQQRAIAGDIAELVELNLAADVQRLLIERLARELDLDVFPDSLPRDIQREHERGLSELIESGRSDTIKNQRRTVEFLREIASARIAHDGE